MSPAEQRRLVVVTGPSGAGKSSIVRQVLSRTGAVFSVSATTRRPRPGEVDGRDYSFVDRPTFEKMVAETAKFVCSLEITVCWTIGAG